MRNVNFIKKSKATLSSLFVCVVLLTGVSSSAFALSVRVASSAILKNKGPFNEQLLCYLSNNKPAIGTVIGSSGSALNSSYEIVKFRASTYKHSVGVRKFRAINAKALAACTRRINANPQKFKGITTGPSNGGTSTPKPTATPSVNYDGLSPVAPFMNKPFLGEYSSTRWFDHRLYEDIPLTPSPNWMMTYSGEFSSDLGRRSSNYVFRTTGGTTLTAVAAGQVVKIAKAGTGKCTDKVRIYQQYVVTIVHPISPTIAYTTEYSTVEQVQVVQGQSVTPGQVIGSAGFVGCTPFSDLIFTVKRKSLKGSYPVDPYGWIGSFTDPHFTSSGITLFPLWLPGQTPGLVRDSFVDVSKISTPTITRVQFMGVRDDLAPNNEFVEVGLGALSTPTSLDISGYKLRFNASTLYTFPAGSVASSTAPIRVYVGSASPDLSGQFLGSAVPLLGSAFDDFCVKLYKADDSRVGAAAGSLGSCF